MDLSAKTMSVVVRQITEVEGEIEASAPNSNAGERDVALDDSTIAALKTQCRRQAACSPSRTAPPLPTEEGESHIQTITAEEKRQG